MDVSRIRSSRRAFFLRGGAVLGAGVAAATGAGALAAPPAAADEVARLREALDAARDREAIGALLAAFAHAIGHRDYAGAATLFADDAHLALSGVEADGRAAIERAFASQYGDQQAHTVHRAYRDVAADALEFSADRREANATVSAEAELCTPLRATCTAAQMARLQGQVADRRWEAGRFEARYVRTREGWRIGSLRWSAIA